MTLQKSEAQSSRVSSLISEIDFYWDCLSSLKDSNSSNDPKGNKAKSHHQDVITDRVVRMCSIRFNQMGFKPDKIGELTSDVLLEVIPFLSLEKGTEKGKINSLGRVIQTIISRVRATDYRKKFSRERVLEALEAGCEKDPHAFYADILKFGNELSDDVFTPEERMIAAKVKQNFLDGKYKMTEIQKACFKGAYIDDDFQSWEILADKLGQSPRNVHRNASRCIEIIKQAERQMLAK